MSISILIASVDYSRDLLNRLLEKEFKLEKSTINKIYEQRFKNLFNNLRDECYLLAETIYVDKVYMILTPLIKNLFLLMIIILRTKLHY